MLISSAFLSEVWARGESAGKRFNFLSVLDTAIMGFLSGVGIAYFTMLAQGEARLPNSLTYGLAAAIGGLVAAVILESLRPHRAFRQPDSPLDVETLEQELVGRMQGQSRWTYWETQNPVWIPIMVFGICLAMLAGAYAFWVSRLSWVGLLYLIPAFAILTLLGGLYVSVNPERLEVRLGWLGLRLLRVPIEELQEAKVHTFSPLQDFGGWGIRMNGEMKAFFFRGNRGVKIRAAQGRQFLIGSDAPEMLAAAIRLAKREAGY
jgi:MFS family permease